jgi:hypothetical protein
LWRFECIDQGPGVAEEDRQRIFDPFVRGSVSPRHRQGGGVGLSIVRELVRAMGAGSIWCRRNMVPIFVWKFPMSSKFLFSVAGWSASLLLMLAVCQPCRRQQGGRINENTPDAALSYYQGLAR